MKSVHASLCVALALALAACGGGNDSATSNQGAIEAVPPPEGGDWTQVVSETEEGGFRMGNPDARVQLVEYASYTCPHCAEFSREATGPLTEMVKTGHVSWEFRPFQMFPTDPGISVLVRCHGPGASFMLTEQLYEAQDEWYGRLRSLGEAELQRLQSLSPQQQPEALVRASGIDEFFRQRGMPEERIRACLADQQVIERLLEITQRGSKEYGVRGTPTFFVNGKLVENAASWGALEPVLRAAMR